MRIIGGALSGRRIEAPRGGATRPTADRVREALFNRIAHGGLEVSTDPLSGPALDLFAGSGALGLEALSRGAPACDFVESNRAACAVVRRNLDQLGLGERGRVHCVSADAYLRRAAGHAYTLVFADPPYADAGAPLERALAHLSAWLAPDALVVVEHGDHAQPATPPALRALDRRRYGQTVISFFASAPRGIPNP